MREQLDIDWDYGDSRLLLAMYTTLLGCEYPLELYNE
jgi:hypothetical protein